MTFRLYAPSTLNFGDFLNCLPVVSGLHKALNEKIKFVVPNEMQKIKGFRDFMEYQGIFDGVYFRSEIIGMEENTYYMISYSEEEFRNLSKRPNRPIETMRHEKFIRDNYPQLEGLNWSVDDDLELQCPLNYGVRCDQRKIIIGDRWSKVTDTRRDWNILRNCGHFNDETKFHFLDYEKDDVLTNMLYIKSSIHPFIGTFTGTGMLADLMHKENFVVWDDSMINWNTAPIEYSYHKHYYANRKNSLVHINDPVITGVDIA